MTNTPVLRDILIYKGRWGLSHARMPTESRPGHVSMFAGFYEDVSSVTKGWQANAVEFDSVFNRSYIAWAWGGPDVIPIFNPIDRAGDDNIILRTYAKGLLDLTAENITQLDDWVISSFIAFMENNSHLLNDAERRGERRGNFIFLHLSAADQMGHTSKPTSLAYTGMIRNIDENLGRLLSYFSRPQFAHHMADTTFIFTADHGMTDWGSHGAGTLHETVTPFLIWGKSISPPETRHYSGRGVDEFGLPKHNYNRTRHSILQADICPLISVLLGTPIPVNSVGEIPLEFLSIEPSLKAQLIRTNALQILVQLTAKLETVRKTHSQLLFKEYRDLESGDIENILLRASVLSEAGKYSEAIAVYLDLIHRALAALNYYHKYDHLFMGFCIISSYIIWSLILFSEFMSRHLQSQRFYTCAAFRQCVSASCFFLFGLWLLAFANYQPLLRTVYQLLPVILAIILCLVPQFFAVLLFLWESVMLVRQFHKWSSDVLVFATLVFLLELCVWSFLHRWLLSVVAVILCSWPKIDQTFISAPNPTAPGRSAIQLEGIWVVACLCLSCFPLLPVIGTASSPNLVLISSICFSIGSLLFTNSYYHDKSLKVDTIFSSKSVLYFLIISSGTSGVLVVMVRRVVANGTSVPILVHLASWFLLSSSLYSLTRMVTATAGIKFLAIALAFFVPFNLMNLFYEGVFYIVLTIITFLWACIECGCVDFNDIWQLSLDKRGYSFAPTGPPEMISPLHFSNIRRPVLYVVLLIFAFFGTGNIASINSFDPTSVYCFMTILNPAAMGTLLIFKILCPMMVVGVGYALSQSISELSYGPHDLKPKGSVLMIVANFLAIHFFALLRDEGSWLDIGTTISHYVIALSIGLASLLLSSLGSCIINLGRLSDESNRGPSHSSHMPLYVQTLDKIKLV